MAGSWSQALLWNPNGQSRQCSFWNDKILSYRLVAMGEGDVRYGF